MLPAASASAAARACSMQCNGSAGGCQSCHIAGGQPPNRAAWLGPHKQSSKCGGTPGDASACRAQRSAPAPASCGGPAGWAGSCSPAGRRPHARPLQQCRPRAATRPRCPGPWLRPRYSPTLPRLRRCQRRPPRRRRRHSRRRLLGPAPGASAGRPARWPPLRQPPTRWAALLARGTPPAESWWPVHRSPPRH